MVTKRAVLQNLLRDELIAALEETGLEVEPSQG